MPTSVTIRKRARRLRKLISALLLVDAAVGMRHPAHGRRTKLDGQYEARVLIADIDTDARCRAPLRELGMPQLRLESAARHVVEDRAPVGAGKRGPGAVGDVHIGDHVIVDVAAKGRDTGRVEDEWRGGLAASERDLETLHGGKGIYLMRGLIVVGEKNAAALGHDR